MSALGPLLTFERVRQCPVWVKAKRFVSICDLSNALDGALIPFAAHALVRTVEHLVADRRNVAIAAKFRDQIHNGNGALLPALVAGKRERRAFLTIQPLPRAPSFRRQPRCRRRTDARIGHNASPPRFLLDIRPRRIARQTLDRDFKRAGDLARQRTAQILTVPARALWRRAVTQS
jgi:hypothetical protein